MNFTFEILNRKSHLDEFDDNVDVEITLADGRVYSATFFTVKNIQALMEKRNKSGESLGGLYFWAMDMVLVERINEEVIRRTVQDMMERSCFDVAFERIDSQ